MRALSLAILLASIQAGPVSAQVFNPRAGCAVRVQSIDFGVYGSVAPPESTSGRVEVLCRGTGARTAVRIRTSAGLSRNYGDRTLINGKYKLHYNLYVDVGHRLIAGDGTSGTAP